MPEELMFVLGNGSWRGGAWRYVITAASKCLCISELTTAPVGDFPTDGMAK